MRRGIWTVVFLLVPHLSSAAPLTLEDLSFEGVWFGSPSLASADTNGGSGAIIRFDERFTGTFTFEHRNDEGWPLRWTSEFLETGTGDFGTPCCGSTFLGGTLEFDETGHPSFVYKPESVFLEDAGTLDFSVGFPTSTLSLRNLTFTPAGNGDSPAAVVPEPATVTLLAGGLAAALANHRRRQRARR